MAKTVGNLYGQVIDFDNIWQSYLAARRGKRYRMEVAKFSANLEENLINIHEHLIWGSWRPGVAREFRVFEPKWRDIQAPPFADRIVHHALVRVVEPYFDRKFIAHSYACRTGKGSQRAVWAVQRMLREAAARWSNPYIVKGDVSKYFASISHSVLFKAISSTISCSRTLSLWWRITQGYGHEGGIGVPVGALTSQLDGNIVMDQFDHAMTDDAGCGMYVRYMDDFVIIAPSKGGARAILTAAEDELARLGLRLNPKSAYFPASRGVDFAGYRVWPTHMLPRKRNIRKAHATFKRLAAQYERGEIGLDFVQPRVNSFLAYTKHCQARRTVEGVLSDFVLTRGA
ncbi:alpha/beta hydrolase [Alcaligenaceae bacterium]|nr:alpha/beta hydrolase [Alcaligenaceae bacterium]